MTLEIDVGTHFCTHHGTNYPIICICWWRILLVATISKFHLLTIRQHGATKKHLFQFPEGQSSGLGKSKKDKHKHQHQLQLLPTLISLGHPNKIMDFISPNFHLTSKILENSSLSLFLLKHLLSLLNLSSNKTFTINHEWVYFKLLAVLSFLKQA